MCKKTVHVTPVQVCGACVFSSPLDDFPLSSSSHLYLQSEMTWRHSAKQCPAPWVRPPTRGGVGKQRGKVRYKSTSPAALLSMLYTVYIASLTHVAKILTSFKGTVSRDLLTIFLLKRFDLGSIWTGENGFANFFVVVNIFYHKFFFRYGLLQHMPA